MGDRNSMNTCQCSTNPFESDYSPERIAPRHLEPERFNEDKTSDSELTVPNPNELLILREKCAEQEAENRQRLKARDEEITKHFEEKQELLGRIAFLKKQKETTEQLGIVGQVEQLRLQEAILSQNLGINQEVHVIQKIKNYKTLETKRDTRHVVNVQDKGKKKEIGNRINEPSKII